MSEYDQAQHDLEIWRDKVANRISNWNGSESRYFRNCPGRMNLREVCACHCDRLREVLSRMDSRLHT
jgi:hypothetical protein